MSTVEQQPCHLPGEYELIYMNGDPEAIQELLCQLGSKKSKDVTMLILVIDDHSTMILDGDAG